MRDLSMYAATFVSDAILTRFITERLLTGLEQGLIPDPYIVSRCAIRGRGGKEMPVG